MNANRPSVTLSIEEQMRLQAREYQPESLRHSAALQCLAMLAMGCLKDELELVPDVLATQAIALADALVERLR